MRVKSGSCALLWLAVSSALLAAPRAPRAVRFPRVVARGQVSMSAVISRKAKKRRAPIVVRLADDHEVFAAPAQPWFSNLTSVSFGGAPAAAVRTSPQR